MNRILIRCPNWIGDQVLAYPFYYFLRRAFPRSRIAAACVPWVSDLMFHDLVDEVIVLPRPRGPGIGARFRALEEGASRARALGPWDLGIALPNSISSAWFLRRSGAQRRRGYRSDVRSWLLNEGVAWNADPGRHRAQAYLDLLPPEATATRDAREFWAGLPEDDLDSGTPGELRAFDAVASWSGIRGPERPPGDYYVIAPGATAESRRWPEEYFVRLARMIADQKGWTGVIVGGASEAVLATRWAAEEELRLLDRTASCPVSGLHGLFSGAKFTVCNESGLAHVAALSGSFVQVVCGAADPRRTRPLGPGRVQVAVNPVDCWPCERNTCSQPIEAKIRCLRGISPETVWEEIQRGLAKPRA